MNALGTQVGGDHYQKYAIQPAEFIARNKLEWTVGNVIKYVMRFRDKDGKADLLKARHYLDILIEAEYPPPPKTIAQMAADIMRTPSNSVGLEGTE